MRNRIQQLSPSVINKIAAGEVIERPASVVKELLENSVDAGATRIELALENGGMQSIRVTDNGSGIPTDQLELAVTSHATSKIVDAEDLFQVGSFGFRGEALASITEVSQSVIRSRTTEQDCGFELEINGGHRQPPQPCGCPVGTTIEVRQLFYNTPVRSKFLKTAQTERGHITEAFTRIALANPHVGMTMLHNDKPVFQLPPTSNWQERIGAFFGPEIADSLIQVSNENGDDQVKISGYVVDPSVSRANNRMQYLFLNKRYIRDRSLQHALSEAYRGLLMTGRFPICFLKMSMPFELVDVNVHPAKLEVRFQNAGQVYSQLLAVIRNRFLTTDLTANAQLNKRTVDDFKPFPATGNTPFTLTPTPTPALQTKFDFQPSGSPNRVEVVSFRSPAEQTMTQHGIGRTTIADEVWSDEPAGATTGFSNSYHSNSSLLPDSGAPNSESPGTAPHGINPPSPSAGSDINRPATTKRTSALQVLNTYLVKETDEGMLVVDQHALHERILYEQLRQKHESGQLESQRLLVPEPVALPPAEAAAVLDNAETLHQLGLDVEPFGGDTVLVTAYPAMLAKQSASELISNIVDRLTGESKNLNQQDLIDELLHMISCKAAIKAGDRLSPEEIDALLEHREHCHNSHHCPHGRPTSLLFSRQELDRRFKRV